MVEVLHKTGIVVGVEEILLVDSCSHKIKHFLGLIFLQQLVHLFEDELEVGLDLQFCDFLSFSSDLVGVVSQVVEESLEMEEVFDVEVDEFAFHDGLDPFEDAVDSGVGGERAIVDHGGEVLKNGLNFLGDLIVLQLEDLVTVIKQDVFVHELEPAHLAQQFLVLGVHSGLACIIQPLPQIFLPLPQQYSYSEGSY